MPLPLNLQHLENINVAPITNLPLLLGINTQDTDEPIKTSKAELELGYLDKTREVMAVK